MSDLAAYGIDATDADLRELGYVKLDVDVDALAKKVNAVGAWCGICDFESGECEDCFKVSRTYVRAVLAALDGRTHEGRR